MAGLVNFNGADADPVPSPFAAVTGWTTLRRLSNQCANSAGSDTDCAMRRTDSTATRSIFEYRSGTFDGGPAFLDSSGNGYVTTLYSGNTVEFYRVTGGPNYSQVGGDAAVTATAGDVFELALDGNDLVFYKNSSEIARRTDSTFRTGLTPAIFEFAGNLRIDNHTDGASGGQSIDVGLSTETDSALSIGKQKIKAIGLATETDAALTAGMSRQISIGLSTETDSAFALGKRKSKAIGLCAETNSAFSITPSGGSSLPTSYSTSFPDTENPIDQDGMFRVGTQTAFYGTPRSTPGKCFAATFVGDISPDYDDCIAHLINHAVPVNQRVSGTVFRESGYDPSDNQELALYLFMEIGAEFVRGYEFLWNSAGSFQIVVWLGTAHDISNFDTGLSLTGAGPGTPAHGDVLSVQVITDGSGNHFEVFKNGVSVGTCDDEPATWEDGNPGMGFFVRPGDTTLANYGFSNWSVTAAGEMQAVGLATETDSALAVSHIKVKAVGLSTSTDSALAIGRQKSLTLGIALETDTALGLDGPFGSGSGTIFRNLPLNWWTKGI